MVRVLCAQHGLSPYLVLFAHTRWHPHVPVSCTGACFVPLLGGVSRKGCSSRWRWPCSSCNNQCYTGSWWSGFIALLKNTAWMAKEKTQHRKTAFQSDKSTHLIYQPAPNRRGQEGQGAVLIWDLNKHNMKGALTKNPKQTKKYKPEYFPEKPHRLPNPGTSSSAFYHFAQKLLGNFNYSERLNAAFCSRVFAGEVL